MMFGRSRGFLEARCANRLMQVKIASNKKPNGRSGVDVGLLQAGILAVLLNLKK
jgi:hypothetical protein